MQNLTAHYNILYNAKLLVGESEKNIALSTADNYDRLIPVYKEPTVESAQTELANLDAAILKANTIANEKSLSNYVDDAYFLIGKANHLKANFFNASEFFSYVYNSYPEEQELRQAALAWKARSLIQSERFEEAETTLDTALSHIGSNKKSAADIYATRAQLHLYAQEDEEAISLLEKAVESTRDKQYKIRWTYLLGQLQQLNGDLPAAYEQYTAVVKSNAPFDMAFNADLNRISIRNELAGGTINIDEELRALLRDDKNSDFIDQIYYQIGNTSAEESDLEKAIAAYNSSILSSTGNDLQKGLSYLRLAEIYLEQSDFLQSKAYYDSTLATLPQTYPDYELISKQSANLDLLADRLSIIAREDTLQMLADLPAEERELRIGTLVREQSMKAINSSLNSNKPSLPGPSAALERGIREGTFYFNSATALRQGLLDFKRRWGNRKLEDDWRRSQKSAADISSAVSPDQGVEANPFRQPVDEPTAENIEAIRQTFIQGIPLTGEQRRASDQKIASAYYDIANYYRDVSLDTARAVETYEEILQRFPDNINKLAIYYNLYRLYNRADPQRSEEFRNRLVNDYPDSPFARIIVDPAYNQKSDEQELEFNKLYNEVYDLYASKKYTEVLSSIQTYAVTLEGRPIPAQLAYLEALAIGRTEKLPALESAFGKLVENHPDDKLIVPLVKQHLAFIDTNRSAMSERTFAIIDHVPDEMIFAEEPAEEPIEINTPMPASQSSETKNLPTDNAPEQAVPGSEQPEESAFFSKKDDAIYYFVVNVSDQRTNLSSSRFGIGQFNRINLPGEGIRHQIKPVEDQNQLIFVGPFTGKNAVQAYYNSINPRMKEIMKIPSDRYTTFFIDQQNLDKITNMEILRSYVEFYKSNY